jgi:hypothetical protein
MGPIFLTHKGDRLVPDQAARHLVIAAFLYYTQSYSIMPDEEYDMMSKFVADNWEHLHEDRKFNLVDPESTRDSGSHFRFTRYPVSAALSYLKDKFSNVEINEPTEWFFDKDHGHYTKNTIGV